MRTARCPIQRTSRLWKLGLLAEQAEHRFLGVLGRVLVTVEPAGRRHPRRQRL